MENRVCRVLPYGKTCMGTQYEGLFDKWDMPSGVLLFAGVTCGVDMYTKHATDCPANSSRPDGISHLWNKPSERCSRPASCKLRNVQVMFVSDVFRPLDSGHFGALLPFLLGCASGGLPAY